MPLSETFEMFYFRIKCQHMVNFLVDMLAIHSKLNPQKKSFKLATCQTSSDIIAGNGRFLSVHEYCVVLVV